MKMSVCADLEIAPRGKARLIWFACVIIKKQKEIRKKE